jgi:hypothetical protein
VRSGRREDDGAVSRGDRPPRLGVLSVHYRVRPFLVDQHRRLRGCVPAVRAMGWELWYFPVVHGGSRPDVRAAARAMSSPEAPLPAAAVDLSRRPLPGPPHKEALVTAYRRLRRSGRLAASDLVAVMDHDAHPLHREAMAAAAGRLLESGAAGLGIPQWHRRRCYLHPSFLLARAATLDEAGPELAFASRRDGRRLGDTGEGFTVWCEENGRSIDPLRVASTGFPWRFWKSENVPDSRAELAGEHGETVRVGHLMRYGLAEGPPLLSHVWSVTLGGHHFSDHDEEEVIAAYLAEPFI